MRTFGSPDFLFIVYALRWTLTLTLVAFIGGGMMGIVLALLRISRFKALRIAVSFYMQVIQGLPLLIMMFLCYYAPSLVGVELGGALILEGRSALPVGLAAAETGAVFRGLRFLGRAGPGLAGLREGEDISHWGRSWRCGRGRSAARPGNR